MALALRFDRQTFTFAKPEQPTTYTSPLSCVLRSLLDKVIGEGHGYCNYQDYRTSFNDMDVYTRLCAQKGCVKVEIDMIDVFHNYDYCFGLQVTYRLTFTDGSRKSFTAPQHKYCSGYYS